MTPSKYQEDVIDAARARRAAVRRGEGVRGMLVDAVPGSGKSELLRMVARALPDVQCEVVSFSERVAREGRAKLPTNATAVTLHAAGKRALEAFMGRRYREASAIQGGDGELAKNKLARILGALKDRGAVSQYAPFKQTVRLVEAARAVGLVPAGAAVGTADPQEIVGLYPDTDESWAGLVAHHGLARPGVDLNPLIGAARAVLRKSIEACTAIIDFGDMVYIPAHLSRIQFPHRQAVFVDEVQDLDPVQRRMVARMIGACPRCTGQPMPPDGWARGDVCARCGGEHRTRCLFVAVGDPFQAIFAWRGADRRSVEAIREEFDCETFPLDICYRCPESHLALARAHRPCIVARPGAPVGAVVVHGSAQLPAEFVVAGGERRDPPIPEPPDEAPAPSPADFRPGDLVICRTNAPLARLATWLARARVPVRVVGRDFGRGLSATLAGLAARDSEQAIAKLTARLRRSEEKDRRDRALDGAASDETASLRDAIEVTQIVAESTWERDHGCGKCGGSGFDPAARGMDYGGACPECGGQSAADPRIPIERLCAEVEALFGDDGASDAVSLMSIHRAKGGEADRVWWLDHESVGAPQRGPDWMAEEARNLRFVALTRARDELHFFSGRDIR